MNAITIYETIAVLIILFRLVMLRIKHRGKHCVVRFTYWLAIVISCMILIRLTDGRMIANSHQVALMVLVALALWADEFLNDDE